jgi:hypothetical protein
MLQGAPLPPGWTGNWGALARVTAARYQPDYLLFAMPTSVMAGTASPRTGHAEAQDRDLVSHMVKLSTAAPAERLLIPAFVFFFFKLYPPAWIADPQRKLAAAAGGCILIRPRALERMGGLQAIRARIIDDCALARAVKDSGGRVWLGPTRGTLQYSGLRPARDRQHDLPHCFASQLGYSYLLLAATLAGLFFTYRCPLCCCSSQSAAARPRQGGVAAHEPLLFANDPLYGLAARWCLCLPVIAVFYLGAVIHSAVQYARGSGGKWKGRVQDG